MKKEKERGSDEDNESVINLSPQERELLHLFLKNVGLNRTQIQLMDTLIAIAKGRVVFDTTYNEVSDIYHPDVPDNPNEKKRRRDNLGDRLRTLANQRQTKNGIEFFAMDRACQGMNEITWRRNPHCIQIKLLFLSRLVDIANEGVTDAKERFERLREVYLSSEGRDIS